MSDQTSLALQSNGLAMQSLDAMSRSMQRQTTREIEHVAKRAIVASVHEQARGQLAQEAMLQAAMLATLQEHIMEIAPLSATNLQVISEAWAIGASKHLMMW